MQLNLVKTSALTLWIQTYPCFHLTNLSQLMPENMLEHVRMQEYKIWWKPLRERAESIHTTSFTLWLTVQNVWLKIKCLCAPAHKCILSVQQKTDEYKYILANAAQPTICNWCMKIQNTFVHMSSKCAHAVIINPVDTFAETLWIKS